MRRIGRAGHRPETAIAGNVAQKTVAVVRAAHDDALTWMIFHAVAVGMPKLIVLSGNECLDGFHVHFLKPRQLAQFQDPIALQFLRRGLILHVADGQAVGEPLAAQLGEERALAHALRSVQHHHAVELDSRLIDARYGGDHHLSGDGADVGCVWTAQIIDEQRIHSRHAVPGGKGFDVVADRVIAALSRDGQQDAFQLAGRVQIVDPFQIDLNRAQVGFVPAGLQLRPRERRLAVRIPADVNTAAMDIVGDVLQLGIIAQNEGEVAEGILHLALLVDLQRVLPVFIRRIAQ